MFMNLNTSNWKEFVVGDLFLCETVSALDINEAINGNIPYITRSTTNNGLTDYYGNAEKIVKGNCITIGAEGAVAFYQPKDFIPGVKIYTIRHSNINEKNAMFIITLLNSSAYCYSYGRARILDKLKQETIKLPCTATNLPDWQFMEDFITDLKSKKVSTQNKQIPQELYILEWKEYRLGDIFEIKKGKRLTSNDQTEGLTPYIGAIDSNNGVANYIGQEPIHLGNTISLSYNGSVGESFYQPNPFWATDDVNVLYFKKSNNYIFNKYLAMFICTILKNEKYRYSYGRKWVLENMKETIIKLPTKDNQPDWQFMVNYIKSLPYGDRI